MCCCCPDRQSAAAQQPCGCVHIPAALPVCLVLLDVSGLLDPLEAERLRPGSVSLMRVASASCTLPSLWGSWGPGRQNGAGGMLHVHVAYMLREDPSMQPDEKSGASFKGVLLLHSLTSEQQTGWQHDKSKEQTSEIKLKSAMMLLLIS